MRLFRARYWALHEIKYLSGSSSTHTRVVGHGAAWPIVSACLRLLSFGYVPVACPGQKEEDTRTTAYWVRLLLSNGRRGHYEPTDLLWPHWTRKVLGSKKVTHYAFSRL